MNVTKNILVKFGTWTKKKIISQDHYSKTVNFSFNGKDSFSTFPGGITTVIIKVGVLVIAILLTMSIFQRGNTTTSVNKVIKDITNDDEKHYFAK